MPAGDFRPTASIENLQARSRLLAQVRRFFDDREFWEVETPSLSADTVVDLHIEPIVTPLSNGERRWLQSSPEFAMKRLVASGAEAIYQVAKCFREEESGPLHNLEFTMVEWYRVGDDYQGGMRLLAELIEQLLPNTRVEFLTYEQAFLGAVGVNPHLAALDQLVDVAAKLSIGVDHNFSQQRDDWLNLLLSESVQPTLGKGGATVLYDYPASQAALARTMAGPPAVAQRFELFVEGIELANGYHELQDADELRRRNDQANRQRAALGRAELPVESRLLEAMELGLPNCCGCAMGFDRLCMLALGANSIEEVMAFPIRRA